MPTFAAAAVAALLAASSLAQTSVPNTAGTLQSNGNGTQTTNAKQGAAPTQANGVPPATSSKPASGTAASQTQGKRRRTGKPARVANGRVEVIGSDGSNVRATMDKPLLPIPANLNALGIPSGTAIHILLRQSVDSGHARNGDMLDATLAQPLANLPVGTPVKLTVVQASPAGALLSFGELSIQVIRIGAHAVLSDTISAQGQEGKKDLADSAPERGTEAVFSAGQDIALPTA